MLIYLVLILFILALSFGVYYSFVKPVNEPLNKAKKFIKQNKYLEAIIEFKKILYNKPDAVEIHNSIADIYIKQNNFEQAIFHLNEIIHIDKYAFGVEKIEVKRKLARAYFSLEDIEKGFQVFLDILRINKEDVEAHYHISFICLGQEEFEIAQKYFDKLIFLQDSFESFFGAGICSFQNNRIENSIKYFEEAISIKPNSDISTLAVAFALQKAKKHKEAISYLSKLVERVTEIEVKFISMRLLSFLHSQANNDDEAKKIMEELLSLTKEKKMEEENKLTLYDIGFFCVKTKMPEGAYNYWKELYNIDSNYENIKELLNIIKKDAARSTSKKTDGFDISIEDYLEDWEISAFSKDFLWNICGLKSNRSIDIKNMFVTTRISKEVPAGKPGVTTDDADYDDRIEKFVDLDTETFRMISNRIILKLGNKVDEMLHTYREADGVDILAYSLENNDKVLVWVRRWKGSNVGEITLRNFAQAVNDIKAKKGLFISTAALTSAAKSGLENLTKISVIYPEQVNELLKGLIKL